MEFDFSGELIEWRGPAPYVYLPVPEDESADIKEASSLLSYGWGCLYVHVTIGGTTWRTALFPKDGRYVVPIKAAVQKAEGIGVGSYVDVRLSAGSH